MDRRKLSLPKPLLKAYINNHYKEFTEFDLIILIREGLNPKFDIDNTYLVNSSKLLKAYLEMGNYDKIVFFNTLAFSSNNISIIKSIDYIPNGDLLISIPGLLEDRKYVLKLLEKKADSSPLLSRKIIDDKILETLAEKNYIPTPDYKDILDLLLTNYTLLERYVKNYPKEIKDLVNVDSNLIELAYSKGYRPTEYDYISNPSLLASREVLDIMFKSDPAFIIFYDSIDDAKRAYLEKKKYIPKLNDVKFSKLIRQDKILMEKAIRVDSNCFYYLETEIDDEVISEILDHIKLTKEDFNRYPNLRHIKGIYNYYKNNNDDFYMYYEDMDMYEKRDILINILDTEDYDQILKINYFDIEYPLDLIYFLRYTIVNPRKYDNDRKKILFNNLNSLSYNYINKTYLDTINSNQYNSYDNALNSLKKALKGKIIDNKKEFNKIINDLYEYINNSEITKSYIKSNLIELSKDFKNKDKDLSNIEFINEIINYHKESFFKREKNILLERLENTFTINEKVINKIIVKNKLNEVEKLFNDNLIEKLGLKENSYSFFNDTFVTILNSIELRKDKLNITQKELRKLSDLFIENKLNKESISDILKTNNLETVVYILKQFDKLKLKLIDNVDDSNVKYDTSNLEFNYKNYIINDSKIYYNNLVDFIMYFNDYKFLKKNNDCFNKLNDLLFFINIFDIKMEDFSKMLVFLNQVNKYNTNKIDIDTIGENYYYLLEESNKLYDAFIEKNKK